MSTLAAALTVMALVTQDQTTLRAAPRDSAAQQAVLWQGDSLEIRGEKGDFLQVYDHRHERAGYVRASQVHRQSIKTEDAAELLSVVRLLRDTPGSEALGIGYVAAFLSAAPASSIDSEIFDALGSMAERLARRASSRQPKAIADATLAHLEVAASYGVKMQSFEQEEKTQLCYDGEAFRHVLAMKASAPQKADAALALTKSECISPSLTPTERLAQDTWRAEVLARVERQGLPEVVKNRVQLRKAGVWASLAFQRARLGGTNLAASQSAGQNAIEALAAVNKSELMDSDQALYNEAAVRVGASRWAAEAASAPKSSGLSIVTRPSNAGETCVDLVESSSAPAKALVTRCTYGLVWPASASANRSNTALALAVQPLDSWRELWVFQKTGSGWKLDVLPPGSDTPTLGYLEFAGWVPDKPEMLAAREIKGRSRPSFEVLRMSDFAVQKQADQPASLSTFYRGQDPFWKNRTISVR